MAGRGPAPKDPTRRVRHGGKADPPMKMLAVGQVLAPELPIELAAIAAVRHWWSVWSESPQAELFGSTDWLFLLETAYLVRDFYAGDTKVAPELRLRVAKFGATPEDRARLRIQFAQADDADAKRPAAPVSRDRYSDLRSVG